MKGKHLFRRLAGVAAATATLVILALYAPHRAGDALETIGLSLREMVLVIPPIFVFLGLLDVWIPREVLILHMGGDSGPRGTVLAFLMGAVAAGPLYAAFPVAAVLLRKGSSNFNVYVFLGAWSTAKIPMFLFEYTALGAPFALTRLAANIPAILIIAGIMARITPAHPIEAGGTGG
jgi:uncharacterized membrane protein YraQ (UPF0718 family)